MTLGVTGAIHTFHIEKYISHIVSFLPAMELQNNISCTNIDKIFLHSVLMLFLVGVNDIFPQRIGISALVTHKLIICGHITAALC